MKILLHYTHYPVSSGRYMTEAFKRLGHEVYHEGPAAGSHVWGLTLPETAAHVPDPAPDGWVPDLAVLMDTAYQWHHPTAPTFGYIVDNHVRDVRQPGIAHYFVAHRAVSIMPWREDMTWLPCAHDPVTFRPSPIPFEQRRYDVALIGVLYPQRWRLVERLRAAGLTVLAGTGLIYDGYAAAYHDARVSLCVSACGDVAQRVFETGALGCAVVSDACGDFAALDSQGVQVFRSDDEAVALCRAAQTRPDWAEACQRWASAHTWDVRGEKILSVVS